MFQSILKTWVFGHDLKVFFDFVSLEKKYGNTVKNNTKLTKTTFHSRPKILLAQTRMTPCYFQLEPADAFCSC
jgi:hypothetical protein